MTSSRSERDTAFGGKSEYLTFFIAGEEYAVSLEFVREVIPYDTVTRVPCMPESVRGVTNLRGNVVPVIDLAVKFRLPETAVTGRTSIVLVETSFDGRPTPIGLMTEEVGQVLSLGAGELLGAPSFGAPVRTDFLLGMAPVGKKFALVLDIQRVLLPEELVSSDVLQAALEAAVPAPAPAAESCAEDSPAETRAEA